MKNSVAYLSLVLVIFVLMSGQNVPATDSSWSYFSGGEPPRGWTGHEFNDSTWQSKPDGWGYRENSSASNGWGTASTGLTVYARREFFIRNPRTVKALVLSVVCPGPFIAYVNGIEVIRNRIGSVSGEPAEELDISGFAHELLSGKNIMSLQCENNDFSSGDSTFVPELEIQEE